MVNGPQLFIIPLILPLPTLQCTPQLEAFSIRAQRQKCVTQTTSYFSFVLLNINSDFLCRWRVNLETCLLFNVNTISCWLNYKKWEICWKSTIGRHYTVWIWQITAVQFFYTEKNRCFVWRGPEESTCYFLLLWWIFLTNSSFELRGNMPIELSAREALKSNKPFRTFSEKKIILCTVKTLLIWLRWALLIRNLTIQWRWAALEPRGFFLVATLLPVHSEVSVMYTVCTH